MLLVWNGYTVNQLPAEATAQHPNYWTSVCVCVCMERMRVL